MPSRLSRIVRHRGFAPAVVAVVIVVGVLVHIVPTLTFVRSLSAGVPAPPAISSPAQFSVPPGQSACMSLVAVEPASGMAEFSLRPAGTGSSATASPSKSELDRLPRPDVELTLTAPGYRASALAHGGYGPMAAALRIDAPSRAVLAKACFANRGAVPVLLEGTTEPRTVTRSAMVVGGAPVVGDIALRFVKVPRQSLLSGLGGLFSHASMLTEGLIPVWLIWLILGALVVCVPLGAVAALYLALREDASRSGSGQPRS